MMLAQRTWEAEASTQEAPGILPEQVKDAEYCGTGSLKRQHICDRQGLAPAETG